MTNAPSPSGKSELPPDIAEKIEEAMKAMAPRWWLIALLGALLVLFGAWALGSTGLATIASVWTIGWFMIVTGVLEVIIGISAREWGRLALWVATGLLYAIAGGVTLSRPGMAAEIFTLLLGAGFVATGVLRAFLAAHLPAGSPRAMVWLSSAVTVLFGVVILAGWPRDSLYVLGTILGVDLIFAGMGWLTLGFGLKGRGAA